MSSQINFRPAGGYPLGAQPMANPSAAPVGPKQDPLSQMQAEQFKNMGNEYRKLKEYGLAAQAYETSIRINPHYTDAYFNYAQLMNITGDTQKAIRLMTQLLYANPNDHDARVIMGEYHEKVGDTQSAKKRYMEVLSAQPDFDPARRRLDFLMYMDQMKFYPDTAAQIIKVKYREVVHKARELLKQYYTVHHHNPVLLKYSQSIPIVFEETQKIDESANIAEYDNKRNVMRVQPQMLFSTPNIVAAYITHELVHALDNDSLTSVLEEQDGYRELARFWSIYQGADNEPNLDRALELYQKSPDKLDQEVRRVYTIRQPNIREKSPGHGLQSFSPAALAAQVHDAQDLSHKQEQLRQALALKLQTHYA